MNNYFNSKKWKKFLNENKKYSVEEGCGDMPPLPPAPAPMAAEVPIPPTVVEDPMTLAAELGSLGLDPAMAQSVVDLLINKGLLGGLAGPVAPSSMMESDCDDDRDKDEE